MSIKAVLPQSPTPSKRGVGGLLTAFAPNKVISPAAARFIVIFQVAVFLVVWVNSPFVILPRPLEVWTAFLDLFATKGLAADIMTSIELNVKALAVTLAIGLSLSYLTVMPFFRPLVTAFSIGRFLSLVGSTFVFTLMVGGGAPLKMALLVMGMSVFFITSMAAVVAEIPREAFDHARTLRMSEWRVVWEVVVLGTADKALEVMRQNAAIGWMMLTMVEGISRSEGGVGAVLLNQQKHFNLAAVFAIQITILLIGLSQDYVIGLIRRILCPYAYLTLERK